MPVTHKRNAFYEIRPQALAPDTAELLIYGDIGEDVFGESIHARALVEDLQQIHARDIVVRINSYGGSVSDGLAIYNALRRHPANITVTIDGVAVSIASLIAMAGDTIEMASNALYMVHAPSSISFGTAAEMRNQADRLDKFADAMANAYIRVVGDAQAHALRALLSDGHDHWFNAQEAKAFGFITAIVEAPPMAAQLDRDKLARFNPPAAAAAFINGEQAMPKPTDHGGTNPAVGPNRNAPAAGGNPAPPNPDPAPAQPAAADLDAARAQARKDALAAEQTRREGIRAKFAPFAQRDGIGEVQDVCLDDPDMSVEAAQSRLLTALGEGAQPLGSITTHSVHALADERDKRIEAKTQALMSRMGAKGADGQRVEASGQNPYRGLRLAEVARQSLTEVGVNVTGQNPEEFATQALARYVQAAGGQTTSDFPIVLENTMHKIIVGAFQAAPLTWHRFAKTGTVTDFRAWKRLAPGILGGFSKKNEAGEYQAKNLPDAEQQTIAADEYGNIITIDRRVLVNDDIGYILALAQDLGMAGARGIERDVYALLATNPKLADGKNLFSASHANQAGSGGAPGVETLAAGRLAMAKQTAPGADSELLDLSPSVALAGIEDAADIQVAVESRYDPDTTGALERPNKVRGLVGDVVGTARISGGEWYLFADPNVAPVVEVVFLNGQNTPRLLQEESFSTGALKWRPTLDYGVGAIGWRGAYKNAGA